MKKISDMYLAAALLSYGVPFTRIDRTASTRQIFIFESIPPQIMIQKEDVNLVIVKTPSLDEVERHFTNNTLWLPPSYPDAVRKIKSAIHNP